MNRVIPEAERRALLNAAVGLRSEIVSTAQALIAVPSPNPPLATGAVAVVAEALVRRMIPGAEVSLHKPGEGVVNLVARVGGAGPGRRLVLSGHLDTYPVNEALPWTVDPLGGLVRDGRLYGRGAADMKGGIAASMTALALLAAHRHAWRGEAVLALSGDEESMGELGAQWLLDHVPEVTGDATIIGDAGSPMVVRFGEKGFLWVEVEAAGKPAHGAHVHLGINAIDRLRAALDALSALRGTPVAAPAAVTAAIASARGISEPLSGAGEADTLGAVTVNIGHVGGGTSMNLIPASARAGLDIRLPVGVSAVAMKARIAAVLADIDGISWRVLRQTEPSFTAPESEIVRTVASVAGEILGVAPAVNMRVGGSDSRLFRKAGIPTVVYGPTPFNMGGADEYALVDELCTVAGVHALAAFDFLSREG
jgi:acetylornithine deacetylase/succinyl-diaminopimelate desuccinylase-like protein